jgi:hypothetical protein
VLDLAALLPSLHLLQTGDDRQLLDELGLVATRQELAIVRTLADELERCRRMRGAVKAIREQLVNELTRLGCPRVDRRG